MNGWAQVMQWLSPIVTWMLVIVGWVILNHQHNKRERRKELRAAIDRLNERLTTLERDALNFHRSTFSDDAARALTLEVQRVGAFVTRLGLLDQPTANSVVIDLRRAITRQNFDASSHQVLPPKDPLLAAISSAVDALISAIERAFSLQYK